MLRLLLRHDVTVRYTPFLFFLFLLFLLPFPSVSCLILRRIFLSLSLHACIYVLSITSPPLFSFVVFGCIMIVMTFCVYVLYALFQCYDTIFHLCVYEVT
jgi:hypothetical protein